VCYLGIVYPHKQRVVGVFAFVAICIYAAYQTVCSVIDVGLSLVFRSLFYSTQRSPEPCAGAFPLLGFWCTRLFEVRGVHFLRSWVPCRCRNILLSSCSMMLQVLFLPNYGYRFWDNINGASVPITGPEPQVGRLPCFS